MPTTRQKLTSLFTRRYPLISGCANFANSSFVKHLSGKETSKVWCQVPGGEVLADLDDYVGRAAYFVGDLDRKITLICNKVVSEGDVVFDIGTNIGLVTVNLARLVGKSGKVHCWEPNPNLQQRLLETISKNSLDSVILNPVALGPENGSMELLVPKGNMGAASLVRDNQAMGDCRKETVSIEVLDEYCKSKNITQVRLIKIDVEGYEQQVFSGAHYLLSEIQPDTILFELNEFTCDNILEEPLIKQLAEYDYEVIALPKNYFSLKPYLLKQSNNDRLGQDFLAIYKGKSAAEIKKAIGVTE